MLAFDLCLAIEVSDIGRWLEAIPWYGWVIGILVLMFLVSDRGLWDYEVKFPLNPSVGRGKVEFECYKRRGVVVEAKFELKPEYQHQEIEIYLEGELVATIDKEKNKSHRLFAQKSIGLSEPNEGAEVKVRIGGEEVFVGALVLD